MKPVVVVYVRNDVERFETECEKMVNKGYVISSTSSACGIESYAITNQAIMVLPKCKGKK